MRFFAAVTFAGLISVASAHFQLQYPAPRGVFVQNSEPTFCGTLYLSRYMERCLCSNLFPDGYTQAVSNRTVFPLSNGVISLNSEHPQWTSTPYIAYAASVRQLTRKIFLTFTVGVIVSTVQNPTAFTDFDNASPAVNFFQTSGEGIACFNIDLLKSGIGGVKDGANVSIEVVFNGGDGTLYQVRISFFTQQTALLY